MPDPGVTTFLFWDIDGTLLTTGRAGIYAWEDAASELAGRRIDLQCLQTAGLTDFAIGARILEQLGFAAEPERLSQIVRRYEAQLPGSLPRRQGRVLEGVRELLDFLRAKRPEIGCYLLTGNTRAGARAKLSHYGLVDYFAGGAFCEDGAERSAIARRALALVQNGADDSRDRVFVIGDTPLDVKCGKDIGARTVAIATGEYSVDELRAHEPWRAIQALPAPAGFIALLQS